MRVGIRVGLGVQLANLLMGMRLGAQPWAEEAAEPTVAGWAVARVAAAAVAGCALPPVRISVAPEERVVAKLSVRPPG